MHYCKYCGKGFLDYKEYMSHENKKPRLISCVREQSQIEFAQAEIKCDRHNIEVAFKMEQTVKVKRYIKQTYKYVKFY